MKLRVLTWNIHKGIGGVDRRYRPERVIEVIAHYEPDLVLLTGDFLTMESNATPGALAEALSPLREAAGRCFAIFGNHDHEAPEEVRDAMKRNGVRLLVDRCLRWS